MGYNFPSNNGADWAGPMRTIHDNQAGRTFYSQGTNMGRKSHGTLKTRGFISTDPYGRHAFIRVCAEKDERKRHCIFNLL